MQAELIDGIAPAGRRSGSSRGQPALQHDAPAASWPSIWAAPSATVCWPTWRARSWSRTCGPRHPRDAIQDPAVSAIAHLTAAATHADRRRPPSVCRPSWTRRAGHVLGGPNGPLARLRAARRAAPCPRRSRHRSTTTSSWRPWRRPGAAWDVAWPTSRPSRSARAWAPRSWPTASCVRGQNNAAGELGYLIVDPGQLGEPHADRPGRARARHHRARPSRPAPADILQGSGSVAAADWRRPAVTSERVLQAALDGDPVAPAGRRARSSTRSSSRSSPWRRPPTRRSSSSTAGWAAPCEPYLERLTRWPLRGTRRGRPGWRCRSWAPAPLSSAPSRRPSGSTASGRPDTWASAPRGPRRASMRPDEPPAVAQPPVSTAAGRAAGPARHRRRMTRTEFLSRYGMAAIFAIVVAILVIANDSFRNPQNLINILQQNSIIGIVACGMLLMIIVGGFDLSVGAVGAMSGVVAAVVIINVGIVPGIVAALACGLAVGAPQRHAHRQGRHQPLRGDARHPGPRLRAALRGHRRPSRLRHARPDSRGSAWARSGPCRRPSSSTASCSSSPGSSCAGRRSGSTSTRWAAGRDASWLAGVNVDRVTIATYGFGSLCAALAGLVLLGQTNIGQPATRRSRGRWPRSRRSSSAACRSPAVSAAWARPSWARCSWASSPTPSTSSASPLLAARDHGSRDPGRGRPRQLPAQARRQP